MIGRQTGGSKQPQPSRRDWILSAHELVIPGSVGVIAGVASGLQPSDGPEDASPGAAGADADTGGR